MYARVYDQFYYHTVVKRRKLTEGTNPGLNPTRWEYCTKSSLQISLETQLSMHQLTIVEPHPILPMN
jgi:hypothetical protein